MNLTRLRSAVPVTLSNAHSRSLVFVLTALSAALFAPQAAAIPHFKLPITKRGFTAESPTSIFRAPAEKDILTCIRAHTIGSIVADDELVARTHFLGCSIMEGTIGPCTIKSVGAPGTEGLILTELSRGLLGTLHEPSGAPGILFEPSTSRVIVTLASTAVPCRTPTTAVEGSLAASLGATGKLQDTTKILFAPISATGKQAVTLILVLSGIVKPKLTSFGAFESTEEQLDLATFEEAVELD